MNALCVDYFIDSKKPVQVVKLTGSIANTVILDEWIDSLVNNCCHQCSSRILARITAPEHSESW